MSKITKLSASRIKTAQTCSWTYWCNYKLKLPDAGNDGSSRGTICHNIFELLGDHHRNEFDKIVNDGTIWNTEVVAAQVKKEAEELAVNDPENLELIDEMIVNGLRCDFFGDENATYKISALDIGIKKNILVNLATRDAYIKVFPHNSKFEDLEAFNPDGYFISNGPGDPEPLLEAQDVAREIIKRDKPLFGICLGHQVIALANGISTYKMHNGHRGINHPVKNLITGKGEITSQNHGFAINREETEANPNVEITHLHLNDNTVAGIKVKDKNCFSVQYHPEASPGPNDSIYLFDQFLENIKNA